VWQIPHLDHPIKLDTYHAIIVFQTTRGWAEKAILALQQSSEQWGFLTSDSGSVVAKSYENWDIGANTVLSLVVGNKVKC
jgi:hypothetical protein